VCFELAFKGPVIFDVEQLASPILFMSKNKIKVGVIGLGRAGWSIHINAIKDDPAFEVTDVADPMEERRKEAEEALGCRSHASIDDLLRDGTPDLVIVATPNQDHESDTMKVLESGRHCVVEKPMAMSHEGAQKLVELAREKKLELFVHHQRRLGDEFQFLREIIDSKIIGDVFEVQVAWTGFARRNDWQTLLKNGGGTLNNTGPHVVDLGIHLFDSPVKELSADVRHVKDAGDADDHVHLFMRTANGEVIDLLVSTSCALPKPRVMLLGTAGTLQAFDEKTAKLRYFDPSKAAPLEVIEGAAPGRQYGSGDVLPWEEEERDMVPTRKVGSFHHNVAAVLNEGAEKIVTPESGAEVVRILEWAGQFRR